MNDEIREAAHVLDDTVADDHVGEVFMAAADKGFRSLDVFVTWFTAGTAAALGLAAANLDRLAGLISMAAIKSAMPWLAVAWILVLAAKFLGSLICTMAGAANEARRIRREATSAEEDLPSRRAFLAAAERAKPWPIGHFTGGNGPIGRKVMRILLWSAISALLSCVCVVIFWGVLLTPAWANYDSSLRNCTEELKDPVKKGSLAGPIAEQA
ncbi:hypothetical protein [Stenotrophomonas sp.]|uniref:hypothetical protein n=1 Tax=Stenotrophomonas sp. TaxID=69392 RepID=UPI0028A2A757|nr:hypothetical protein [Stenotrophomonas sp.]